jgi:hypothetical protein
VLFAVRVPAIVINTKKKSPVIKPSRRNLTPIASGKSNLFDAILLLSRLAETDLEKSVMHSCL